MNRETARKKAEKLVGQMTIEEKMSQVQFDSPAISRLGIPAYNYWNEALHGVARAGTATVFPQAIALAAAFDTELLQEIAQTIAEEGRAKYNAASAKGDRDIYKGLTFWSPNINIFRDPRWGRGHETYGEDPYLTGELGTAFVKGLQGDGETMKAAACAKHFAVHSGPEDLRHKFDAQVSRKDLWETYLPAFEKLVKKAKVEAVMGAYNRTNGEPCNANHELMQTILRGKWGFEGHYMSDCMALRDFHEGHHVTKNGVETAALAMEVGCDGNCGLTYKEYLAEAYRQGKVSEERITQAVVRLYTTRVLLGLFDGSEYDQIPYSVVECEKHRKLAVQAAQESMVLLKNKGILPLQKAKLHSIGVIGPNADSRAALMGNYYGTSSHYTTLLEGIQKEAGEDIRVFYSVGAALDRSKTEELAQEDDRLSEAATVAENSDVVILCLGLDETLEGEEHDEGNAYGSGDKKDLLLPPSQRRLMETVAETGKPVILCLMAGSDIDLSYADAHFDAILDLWYPGAEGGTAAAKVLFGEAAPSGKLPVTFYEDLSQLPAFTDYSMKGRTYRYLEGKAQFPFGFGLTYEKVNMESADYLEKEHAVRVEIRNTGKSDCKEVLQVYVRADDSDEGTPNPKLCGFHKVSLQSGEEKQVVIPLDEYAFEVVDQAGNYRSGGKHFTLYVGKSQPDERSVELMGESPIVIRI